MRFFNEKRRFCNYIEGMIFDEIVNSVYSREEYPALGSFSGEWACTLPFSGLRVLVATPIFRNTLLEYRALIAGGAELYVGRSVGGAGEASMPCDEKIVEFLRANEIEMLTPQEVLVAEAEDEYLDLILDCAGQFSKCHPRYGFVELTRSGVQFFEKCELPVYVADSGIVKRIETTLGTGDGYFRALEQLGYGSGPNGFEGKKLVVFGSGKVGAGIALQGVSRGCSVCTVTQVHRVSSPDFIPVLEANSVDVVDCDDIPAVTEIVSNADFVVTATGVKNALAHAPLAKALLESKAVLANMGVEDEYGPAIPSERVLAGKQPLNFVLEEPTHLKYIDASLALHAALGELLVQEAMGAAQNGSNAANQGDLPVQEARDDAPVYEKERNTLRNPPSSLEQRILMESIQNGVIAPEINVLLGGLPTE